MCGNSKHENRETPKAFQGSFFDLWERSENVSDGTADVYAIGESDEFIVPLTRANKTATAAAESVEERDSPKGRISALTSMLRAQNRNEVSTGTSRESRLVATLCRDRCT